MSNTHDDKGKPKRSKGEAIAAFRSLVLSLEDWRTEEPHLFEIIRETDELKHLMQLLDEKPDEAATTITRLTAENARQAAEIEGLRAFVNDTLKFAELVKDVGVWSEGIHSGLRKGTDAPSAGKLWNAIAASRDSAWQDAIRFAIDPFFSLWGGNKLIDAARALTGGQP